MGGKIQEPPSAGVSLWDLSSSHRRSSHFIVGAPSANANSLSFNQDGSKLSYGTDAGVVATIDMESGQEKILLSASGFPIERVAWSPSEDVLAALGWDGVVRLWLGSEGKPIERHYLEIFEGGGLHAAAWSVDGRYFAGGGSYGPLFMLDRNCNYCEVAQSGAINGLVEDLVVLNGGQYVVALPSQELSLIVWDVEDKLVKRVPFEDIQRAPEVIVEIGREDQFTTLGDQLTRWALLRDGELVRLCVEDNIAGYQLDEVEGVITAVSDFNHSIVLFRGPERLRLAVLSGHSGDILDLDFAREGTRLASGDRNGEIIIWDLRDALQDGEAIQGEIDATLGIP